MKVEQGKIPPQATEIELNDNILMKNKAVIVGNLGINYEIKDYLLSRLMHECWLVQDKKTLKIIGKIECESELKRLLTGQKLSKNK